MGTAFSLLRICAKKKPCFTPPLTSLPRLQRACHAEFTERKRNRTIVKGKRKETERNWKRFCLLLYIQNTHTHTHTTSGPNNYVQFTNVATTQLSPGTQTHNSTCNTSPQEYVSPQECITTHSFDSHAISITLTVYVYTTKLFGVPLKNLVYKT